MDVRSMTMVEAVRDAMDVALARDPRVIVFGQDVGYFGGVFRCTQGLQEKHGRERCFDTPISESGIVGSAIGMAAYGMRPCVEMQFADYMFPAYDQITQEAARIRYRSNGDFTCPMVIRMPTGGGIFGGETHSQSPESLFTHVSGLKTILPSSPYDAKGLLIAAIEDPDPVIFLEPKQVYRSMREEVPDEEETLPIGGARRVREGDGLTMVAWGAMLHRTLEAAETLSGEDGVEAEVFDLATLAPLDTDSLAQSVRRTGRLVVVHEAPMSYGPAGEIAQRIAEAAFLWLEAPVERVTGWDTMVPYFAREQHYMPDAPRILDGARACLSF